MFLTRMDSKTSKMAIESLYLNGVEEWLLHGR